MTEKLNEEETKAADFERESNKLRMDLEKMEKGRLMLLVHVVPDSTCTY